MKNRVATYSKRFIYILPLLLLLCYFLYQSFSFPLHDFANSYFPAHIVANYNAPEDILFDIYKFNSYIWDLGYEDVLADFYLNSPFNAIVFYPFSLIEDAYLAKVIFNGLSSLLFLLAIYSLFKKFGKRTLLLIITIPILFYVPLRNQILFGQSYFLAFAFVVFGFLWIEKNKEISGGGLLTLAALLKVFPVAYGIPLLFKSQWKVIISAVLIGLVILVLSIWFTGTSVWETYFFEVLPNAIKNKSTVNFQYNAQSIDVFLKTLFVQDAYYNPTAIFNNERLYVIIKWLLKSIIIGIALSLSFSKRKDLYALLSIWIVTLFLMQSRTATYAQILWVIPAFYIFTSKVHAYKKISFFAILFLVCNLPISRLEHLPIIFKFSRLWLTIGLAIFFFFCLNNKINFKYLGLGFLLILPLHLDMFTQVEEDTSTYVLEKQEYFMIFDFAKNGNFLSYDALGRNGKETIKTSILVSKFDDTSCVIENNQITLNGRQLTKDSSLKKKPILVNECEVYYLTDIRSRRGAFTLKKIDICD
jgi:hypothetical protein